MPLRDYQQNAVDELKRFIADGRGNPCVIAPTGSGKSWMIASFIHDVLESYPDTKVLMLTHQKELIEQDMDKLGKVMPGIEMGVYSASLGEKDASKQVTFASIQSIYKRTDLWFGCVIVDECHLINNEEEGMYRTFLAASAGIIIGFTATPFRLGQGEIVGPGTIFTDYIECEGILSLQKQGYLTRLSTKKPKTELSVNGVGKAMGEFKQKELEAKINVSTTNEAVVTEAMLMMAYAERKHAVVFCSGVSHAYDIARLFNEKGIPAVCVEGSMTKEEREQTLEEFTSGRAMVITNYGVLTTGFDYPAIDCIILLRPTLSPGLYMQMLGRGLRIAEGKDYCLVLDFAGNIDRHGPISKVKPPSRKQMTGDGIPPMKVCPKCLEVLPASTMECPSCGYKFPVHANRLWDLFTGDVNGDETDGESVTMHLIDRWTWVIGKGKNDPFYERYEVVYTTVDNQTLKEYVVFDDRCKPFVTKMNINKIFKYCTEFGLNFSKYVDTSKPLDSAERLDWKTASKDIANAGPPAAVFTRPNRKNDKFTDIVGIMSAANLEKEQMIDAQKLEVRSIYES